MNPEGIEENPFGSSVADASPPQLISLVIIYHKTVMLAVEVKMRSVDSRVNSAFTATTRLPARNFVVVARRDVRACICDAKRDA